MKTFSEIEKEFGSFTFRDEDKSGHVNLNGKKSLIKIDSDSFIKFPEDKDNFFNFQTVVHENIHVRFENAFYTLYPQRLNDTGGCRAEAYSNIVIIDSDALGKEGTLTEIKFELKGLSNHLNYQFLEDIPLDRKDRDFSHSLRRHQAKKRKEMVELTGIGREEYSSSGGKITELYAVRLFPKIFSFRIEGQIFECFYSYSRRGFGGQNIKIEPYICLRIVFDNPVTIQAALDAAFNLKRFFSQQQMGPITFNRIFGRSKTRPANQYCSFYLPSEAVKLELKSPDNYYTDPGSIVLNEWSQRKQLATLIEEWLVQSEQRNRYRLLVDAIGNEINKSYSLEQIATLCSAVESLDELKVTDDIGSNIFEDMAVAAKQVADKHKIDLSKNRIKDCLSPLKRKSLAHRIKLMFMTVKEQFNHTDIKIGILTKSVNELRTAAVHGSSLPKDISPKLTSTNRALHALCVLYDITTCDTENRIVTEDKAHPAAMVFQESFFSLRATLNRPR